MIADVMPESIIHTLEAIKIGDQKTAFCICPEIGKAFKEMRAGEQPGQIVTGVSFQQCDVGFVQLGGV